MEFLFGITLGFVFGFTSAITPSFIVIVKEDAESGKMFVEYKKKLYRLVRDA